MGFHADLHVHSKYSRATSRDLDLEHLAAWACRKGIGVVATGDFTHPAWCAELKQKLVPAEPGLFRLRSDIEQAIAQTLPAACRTPVRFMLEVEISTIYKKADRTRKIHHLIYAPDFETVDRISARLARIGNIASDGRPILGLDSRDLLEIALESGPHAYLVPAHIWTPWFAALGSQSGFDSIAECYGDLADRIFAVETGLSSDPPMNWRVSFLDRYRLMSNSDAHSPGKLGREATTFDCDVDYFAIKQALETGRGYVGTVEFFPDEGKYHLDGHRKCEVRLSPKETLAHGGRCPVCGGALTIGVEHRVEVLADRSEAQALPPPSAGAVSNLVPLPEILSELSASAAGSRTVAHGYGQAIAKLGPEAAILAGEQSGDRWLRSPRAARCRPALGGRSDRWAAVDHRRSRIGKDPYADLSHRPSRRRARGCRRGLPRHHLYPPRCRRNARSAGGAPSRWRRTSGGSHLPFARPFHPSRARKRGGAAPRLSRRGRSGTRRPHRRDARSSRARSAAGLACDLAGEAHAWRRGYRRGQGRLRRSARRAQLGRLRGCHIR